MKKTDVVKLIKDGVIAEFKPLNRKDIYGLKSSDEAEVPFYIHTANKSYLPGKNIIKAVLKVYSLLHEQKCIEPEITYKYEVLFRLDNSFENQDEKLKYLEYSLDYERKKLYDFFNKTHTISLELNDAFLRWFNSFYENHLDFIFWLNDNYVNKETSFSSIYHDLIPKIETLGYVSNTKANETFEALLQMKKIELLKGLIVGFQKPNIKDGDNVSAVSMEDEKIKQTKIDKQLHLLNPEFNNLDFKPTTREMIFALRFMDTNEKGRTWLTATEIRQNKMYGQHGYKVFIEVGYPHGSTKKRPNYKKPDETEIKNIVKLLKDYPESLEAFRNYINL